MCLCGCAEFRRSMWLALFASATDASLCSRCAHARAEHTLVADSTHACSQRCSQYATIKHGGHAGPRLRRSQHMRWRDGFGALAVLPNDVLTIIVTRMDVASACRLLCASTALQLFVSSHDRLWQRWCLTMPWRNSNGAAPQLAGRCCWRAVFVGLSKGEAKLQTQLLQCSTAHKMLDAVAGTDQAAEVGADPFGLNVIERAVDFTLRAKEVTFFVSGFLPVDAPSAASGAHEAALIDWLEWAAECFAGMRLTLGPCVAAARGGHTTGALEAVETHPNMATDTRPSHAARS